MYEAQDVERFSTNGRIDEKVPEGRYAKSSFEMQGWRDEEEEPLLFELWGRLGVELYLDVAESDEVLPKVVHETHTSGLIDI